LFLMHVLLIEGVDSTLAPSLEKFFPAQVRRESSIQTAIELLEKGEAPIGWVVCDHRGPGTALLKCLLTVRQELPCVLVVEPGWTMPDDFFLVARDGLLETIERAEPAVTAQRLEALLTRLQGEGYFEPTATPDAGFLKVRTNGLELQQPLRADIFIRLGKNRYARRFRREDEFDMADLNDSLRSKGVTAFYIHKEDVALLVQAQSARLDQAFASVEASPAQARVAAEGAMVVVQDVVAKLGFTRDVQKLARKAAELTLKAMGASPNFGDVLDRIKRHEGRYITSHSLMLAEIACAVAHRMGIGSSQVFIKLAMAAVLHDLMIEDDVLARVRSVQEIIDPTAARKYKLHPVKAAEYASQFTEIPSEVDTILLEHHEKPDGTGFPRGLFHNQMNQLTCVFIVAHDLLDFFLDQVPSNDRGAMIPAFVNQRRPALAAETGTFQKILDALASEGPLGP
jgi:HD-GYP domain-containing protein (c-di-GMP phosphodiesterase class II)